jgi:PIN domain nuclease of toxin-antitoxin system
MEFRSFVDTHVLAWLLAGEIGKVSPGAREALAFAEELWVSPMVRLELQFMSEIGRLSATANQVLEMAARRLGVQVRDASLDQIALHAVDLTWTRDPFDRVIVAHARLDGAQLITKDRLIRKHYPKAVW